jgi:hypothetical protein
MVGGHVILEAIIFVLGGNGEKLCNATIQME